MSLLNNLIAKASVSTETEQNPNAKKYNFSKETSSDKNQNACNGGADRSNTRGGAMLIRMVIFGIKKMIYQKKYMMSTYPKTKTSMIQRVIRIKQQLTAVNIKPGRVDYQLYVLIVA